MGSFSRGGGSGLVTDSDGQRCGWDVWVPRTSPKHTSPDHVSPKRVSPASTSRMTMHPQLGQQPSRNASSKHRLHHQASFAHHAVHSPHDPPPGVGRLVPTANAGHGAPCSGSGGRVTAASSAARVLVWGWWHWSGSGWEWCDQHVGYQHHVPAHQAPARAFAPQRPPYLDAGYYWPDASGVMRDAHGQHPAPPVHHTVRLPVQAQQARGGTWQSTPLGQWFFSPYGMAPRQALALASSESTAGGGGKCAGCQ